MKRTLIFFGILFLCIFATQVSYSDNGKIRTVVIDPGHGGRDPGALGSKSKEKDIVLAIGLKLGRYIEENLPEVNVVYTRKTDEFVKLFKRAEIANENNADLFISIHCNANPSSRPYGTETFVMGDHRREANLEVAKRENAAILYEEDYEETYGGFDPYSPESHIIFNLYQNAYLENSLSFASVIQHQFQDRAQRVNRGVKRAGFLVLYQITMPGVLIEAGFLSNPREEKYLMSETGQTHIASAIFRAFRDYKEEQEQLYLARKGNSSSNPINNEKNPLNHINDEKTELATSETDKNNTAKNDSNISFRVQIATTSEERPLDSQEFENLNNVNYYYHEGLYKYTVGDENTLEAAIEIQEELKQAGFEDAFVVAFLNDVRISPSEAIKIIRELKSDNR